MDVGFSVMVGESVMEGTVIEIGMGLGVKASVGVGSSNSSVAGKGVGATLAQPTTKITVDRKIIQVRNFIITFSPNFLLF